MKEKEIEKKGYKKKGDNLYLKDGIYYVQDFGEMVEIGSMDAGAVRQIADYDRYLELAGNKKNDVQDIEAETVEETEEKIYQSSKIVEAEPVDQSAGLIQPAATGDEIAELYNKYDEIKSKIITDNDKMSMRGQTFTKKSGWRKIATAFNISDTIIKKERDEIPEGVKWTVEVEAVAPNGRRSHGIGMCDSAESGKSGTKEHDILATAHTRAKNRAISDLLGGEVSAEEMG